MGVAANTEKPAAFAAMVAPWYKGRSRIMLNRSITDKHCSGIPAMVRRFLVWVESRLPLVVREWVANTNQIDVGDLTRFPVVDDCLVWATRHTDKRTTGVWVVCDTVRAVQGSWITERNVYKRRGNSPRNVRQSGEVIRIWNGRNALGIAAVMGMVQV